MITTNGYSKDPSIMPEGIVNTWSEDLINQRHGMEEFCRIFERSMRGDDGLWYNKALRPPKHDIIYVYIIVAGVLKYRCYYGGYSTQQKPSRIKEANKPMKDWHHYSWALWHTVLFPHIILAGPIEICPFERELKGFQGFRYCTKLF